MKNAPVRIGTSLRSGYPVGDARTGARWMVERAAAARAAGLDSLFVGDHHLAGAYYQNSPIMGRLLAEWDDRLCGALYLLALWHPVLLAEQVATLAAVARGP
ncbi:MAG: LLM class flavin-dependent oxidoreductase, partial [Acidimicrobiales bacterium]